MIEADETDVSRSSASKRKPRIIESSGNIFADLRLPNPDRELLKARLTSGIHSILKTRNLRQAEITKFFGISQPQASALVKNRSGNLSVSRLRKILRDLVAAAF